VNCLLEIYVTAICFDFDGISMRCRYLFLHRALTHVHDINYYSLCAKADKPPHEPHNPHRIQTTNQILLFVTRREHKKNLRMTYHAISTRSARAIVDDNDRAPEERIPGIAQEKRPRAK
jgi:hypothetical protein